MNAPSLFFRQAVALLLLACALQVTATAGTLEQIRQRGKLVVGVSYVVPEYTAGTKYRTPESFDSTVAAELAKQLGVKLVTVKVTTKNRQQLLAQQKVDVLLLNLKKDDADALASSARLLPTAYQSRPKLIMRSDTYIKRSPQLKGRTLCVAAGGAYVGSLAAQYGALEKVYKAPADALLALRTGACDAAVHDDAVLNGLLALPEWKKFSASLPLDASPAVLTFAVRRADADLGDYLQQLSQEWSGTGYWAGNRKRWINDVAFEVYLDQNVPDCH
ncbi:bacterial extracellular solute-binding s, 3 family protein [Collimonas arenae]|uniref:Bacterial extracellular solute-binding s, 3 family protein n=1 Tax=Collimonas arenae TaxID=279058 RepID=A0A127QMM0_9BURK|nr:transporter substrate-binding domain-containing protein [Collimonas arenae]AMP01369.1 bacterial extracellular solute-binding s, 3 family protein [Collimonas arenae]AMP11269.1 bacterial extracellular solute-binding s, 3 family protein [Collimonas arenae]